MKGMLPGRTDVTGVKFFEAFHIPPVLNIVFQAVNKETLKSKDFNRTRDASLGEFTKDTRPLFKRKPM